MEFPLSELQIREKLGFDSESAIDFVAGGGRVFGKELAMIISTVYHAQFGYAAIYGIDKARTRHLMLKAQEYCRRLGINPNHIAECTPNRIIPDTARQVYNNVYNNTQIPWYPGDAVQRE